MRALRPIFGKSHGPVSYVLRTTAFQWASVVLLITATLPWSRTGPFPFEASSVPLEIVALLVVAPLFENLVLVILIEFIKLFELRDGDAITVGIIALLAAASHAKSTNAFGIGPGLCFGLMAYTYLAWTELSSLRRYAMTVAQHMLANLPLGLLLTFAIRA